MSLQRFLDAQNGLYDITFDTALMEMRRGRRRSRWLPYITPKLLLPEDDTEMGRMYGLEDLDEAREFLHHPILGRNMRVIIREINTINGVTAMDIMGSPYDQELHACLTLFNMIRRIEGNHNSLYYRTLDKFFAGLRHPGTMDRLGAMYGRRHMHSIATKGA